MPDEYADIGIYGVWLWTVPNDLDLSTLDSFPPESAEMVDMIPGTGADEDSQEELDRARDRFNPQVANMELAPDRRLVVARYKGQDVTLLPWHDFSDTLPANGAKLYHGEDGGE